LFIRNCLRLG